MTGGCVTRLLLDQNNRQQEKEKAQVATDICSNMKNQLKKSKNDCFPSKVHTELSRKDVLYKVLYKVHCICVVVWVELKFSINFLSVKYTKNTSFLKVFFFLIKEIDHGDWYVLCGGTDSYYTLISVTLFGILWE